HFLGPDQPRSGRLAARPELRIPALGSGVDDSLSEQFKAFLFGVVEIPNLAAYSYRLKSGAGRDSPSAEWGIKRIQSTANHLIVVCRAHCWQNPPEQMQLPAALALVEFGEGKFLCLFYPTLNEFSYSGLSYATAIVPAWRKRIQINSSETKVIRVAPLPRLLRCVRSIQSDDSEATERRICSEAGRLATAPANAESRLRLPIAAQADLSGASMSRHKRIKSDATARLQQLRHPGLENSSCPIKQLRDVGVRCASALSACWRLSPCSGEFEHDAAQALKKPAAAPLPSRERRGAAAAPPDSGQVPIRSLTGTCCLASNLQLAVPVCAIVWLTASTALRCTGPPPPGDACRQQVEKNPALEKAKFHISKKLEFSDLLRLYMPSSRVQYKFMGLQSHNQSVLLHPRLTCPVPALFQPPSPLNLQCTKRVSGVAEFEIHAVFQFSDRPEKRSLTMQHRFRKACLSARRRRNHRKKQRAANSSPSRRRSDRRQQRRRRGDRRRGGKKGRNSRQRRQRRRQRAAAAAPAQEGVPEGVPTGLQSSADIFLSTRFCAGRQSLSCANCTVMEKKVEDLNQILQKTFEQNSQCQKEHKEQIDLMKLELQVLKKELETRKQGK
uniref:DUF4708 domain-containing protein n=1 Tax=Macrostomum lignano TaxID=282301 RepID=A0A1I8JL22_9PLAT